MQIDSFITYLKTERRYSSCTVKAYENDLLQFKGFSSQDGHEDTSRQIRKWIIFMMENGLSPRSIRRKISSLGSYFNYLIKEGQLDTSPLSKVTIPKTGKRLPDFISEASLNHLLDNIEFGDDFAGVRNRLIVEILYFTGMRRSELVKLRNSDVNSTEMSIKVNGKGGKQRMIPVGRTFSQTLSDYKLKKEVEFGNGLPEDPFFVTDKNKCLYPELVYRVVRKYLQLVSPGPGRSPHILRHSFATHMLNHGADLGAIKELLGHASLAATQVYTHNSFEKLKKIYKQAHPRA
ncbi:MAG: tyrosine-type recombinase/integrase [Bacteroidales bacterium]